MHKRFCTGQTVIWFKKPDHYISFLHSFNEYENLITTNDASSKELILQILTSFNNLIVHLNIWDICLVAQVAEYRSVGLWKLRWASQMHVNQSWKKKYQSFKDCKNQIFQQQIFATRAMGFSNSFNKASPGSKQRGCERKTNWASGTLILFCRIPTESLSWECSTLVRDDVQPDGELTPAWQCPGRHEGWCL